MHMDDGRIKLRDGDSGAGGPSPAIAPTLSYERRQRPTRIRWTARPGGGRLVIPAVTRPFSLTLAIVTGVGTACVLLQGVLTIGGPLLAVVAVAAAVTVWLADEAKQGAEVVVRPTRVHLVLRGRWFTRRSWWPRETVEGATVKADLGERALRLLVAGGVAVHVGTAPDAEELEWGSWALAGALGESRESAGQTPRTVIRPGRWWRDAFPSVLNLAFFAFLLLLLTHPPAWWQRLAPKSVFPFVAVAVAMSFARQWASKRAAGRSFIRAYRMRLFVLEPGAWRVRWRTLRRAGIVAVKVDGWHPFGRRVYARYARGGRKVLASGCTGAEARAVAAEVRTTLGLAGQRQQGGVYG